MIIGLFATEFDAPYLARFRPIVGSHAIKVCSHPQEYLTSFASKVRASKLDAVICTCPETMTLLLSALPDFRHPLDKRGNKRKLALDDYAGSLITISAERLGYEKDLEVLFLNPLKQLISTAEGEFVFRRFVSKITRPESWFPQAQFTWETWTPSKSDELLSRFSRAKLLAVDIETYVGDVHRRIHCVGYCGLFPDGSTHSVVVPFKDMLAHQFVRRLNATSVPKVMQRGIYDNIYFARWNTPCTNYLYDTLNLFHCWYSELPKRLDFITAFTVREVRYWKDDSAGSEHNMFEYNAKDCWATLHAWCALVNEIPQWVRDNYVTEFPMVFPSLHCALDGMRVDVNEFERKKATAEAAVEVQRAKLAAWFGPAFNPNSPIQCKNLLQVLGMKQVESADNSAMTACASVHPFNELIISAILAYRKQAKLLSTYFKLDKFWNNRLYYSLDPAGTDTGRLASTESSFWCGLQVQNIPQGDVIKSWLTADEGWLLAENDYSQSEARCVAYMSGCMALITLLESDKDYHKANASAFFGVPYEAIDKPLRQLAKRVGHGANYSMGPAVLLQTMGPKAVAEARLLLKLPAKWTLVQVCQHLLRTYELAYPEVKKDWYEAIRREISLSKKLKSPLGWTRYFFDDPAKSKPAMNAAVAHGPQNLSVSIINKVFYRIWHDSVYGDLRGRIRLKAQIHDSILYSYRDPEIPKIVSQRMQHTADIKDCHGIVRKMLIPNDCNFGEFSWGAIK